MIFMIDAYREKVFNLDDIEEFSLVKTSGLGDYNVTATTRPNQNGTRKTYIMEIGDKRRCQGYLENRIGQSIILNTDKR